MIEKIRKQATMIYIAEFSDDPDDEFYQESHVAYFNSWGDRGIGAWFDAWRAVHITGSYNNLYGSRVEPRRHVSGSNLLYVDGHVGYDDSEEVLNIDNWDDQLYGYQGEY